MPLAVILAILFIAMIWVRATIKPGLAPPGPGTTFNEKLKALGDCIEIIVLIVLVLGGLIIGWFTPTEAGEVAAFGAIVVSLARKRLRWRKFKEALGETIKTTGMIFMIMIGAFIMNSFIALSTIPQELANLVAGFGLPPLLVIGLIVLVYIILGCFIDTMSMIVLTIPVFFPLVVDSLGFSPVWFGVIIVLVTEMAMVTPPIGINVYVIAGIAKDVPMETIFKGIFPFVGMELLFIIILILFPSIALIF
jgi:C4-dicarboxylate transporter DctM subunit